MVAGTHTNETGPQVQVGRDTYRLRAAADLPVQAWLQLDRLSATVIRLLTHATVRDLTDAEASQLSTAMTAVCQIATDIPVDRFLALSDDMRLLVVQQALTAARRPADEADDPPEHETEFDAAFARLSRFYGGTPDYWRSTASWRDVRRYLRMIPVLQAEESLMVAARVALGSGVLKRADARALQRQWERRTGRPSRRDRPPTDPRQLAALGIGLEEKASPAR